MRLLSVAMLAALLIGGGVAGFETAVGATVTPTAKVVVRPVTSTGHVRAGFTMVSEPTGLVDCNAQDPSPGAVSRNIEFCSPSAEYAIACWKAAAPHRVLCMRDPRSTRVVRIPRTGTFAPTGLAPLSQRAPLAITLGGGAYCSIRDGGAWPTLRSHPSWVGTYSCNNGDAVWAPPTATHNGVNESSASWTVRTARSSGVGPVVTRHVVRAYFVGTYPG